MTMLERLAKEWRDAQKAIDRLTPEERKFNIAPLERLITAHNALVKYIDEEIG